MNCSGMPQFAIECSALRCVVRQVSLVRTADTYDIFDNCMDRSEPQHFDKPPDRKSVV